MNFFKFLLLSTLFFIATFSQRFQRHLNTQNGFINGNTELNNPKSGFLASGGSKAIQDGPDIKFVGDEEIELELDNNELKFRFCSDGCIGQT